MTLKRLFGLLLIGIILVNIAIVVADVEDEPNSDIRREQSGKKSYVVNVKMITNVGH